MDDYWMIETVDKDDAWSGEPEPRADKADAMQHFKWLCEQHPDLRFNLVRCEIVKRSH